MQRYNGLFRIFYRPIAAGFGIKVHYIADVVTLFLSES